MDFKNIRRCVAGIVLALAAVGLGLSPVDAAEKESKALATRVTAIDFDECTPFQIRAKIMELHPENGTIVVAEKEIRPGCDCRGKTDQNRIPHNGWQTGIAERLQRRPVRVDQGGAAPRRICGRLCGAENRKTAGGKVYLQAGLGKSGESPQGRSSDGCARGQQQLTPPPRHSKFLLSILNEF